MREVEAWLLADRQRFASFFQIPITAIPNNPESIDNPKEFVANLAGRSRSRAIKDETYLPYALALGVEQQWTEQFADVLAAASRPEGGTGYHPRWYSGSTWNRSHMGGFAGSVGSALSSAISSSSTAPGSRSGGGGGGSSGGGGGGGGGGAW